MEAALQLSKLKAVFLLNKTAQYFVFMVLFHFCSLARRRMVHI